MSYQQLKDQFIGSIKSEIARLQKELSTFLGNDHESVHPKGKTVKKTVSSNAKGKKRARRSTEEMDKEALDIVAFVKSKGKNGMKAKEITAKFGTLLPSIKVHVNGRAVTKNALKSRGPTNNTVYYVG